MFCKDAKWVFKDLYGIFDDGSKTDKIFLQVRFLKHQHGIRYQFLHRWLRFRVRYNLSDSFIESPQASYE